jgi:hypothetical protein
MIKGETQVKATCARDEESNSQQNYIQHSPDSIYGIRDSGFDQHPNSFLGVLCDYLHFYILSKNAHSPKIFIPITLRFTVS